MSNANQVDSANILRPNDFGRLTRFCSPQSIAYLENSLRRLESGQPPTPSFKLYGSTERKVVEDFIELAAGKIPVPEWVLEYEKKRLEKFAPQGGIPAWKDVEQDFLLYKTACRPVKYVSDRVMRAMKADYRYLHCSQLSADKALEHLKSTDKIEDRAAGWSEFQLKKTDPEAQRNALRFCKNHDWKYGVGYTFTRLVKKRLRIFMPMPFSSMICQAQYFIPFLSGIQKDILEKGLRSPSVLWADKVGFERCFDIMDKQIKEAHIEQNEKIVYYTLDFLKMDTATATDQYKKIFLPVMDAAFGGKSTDRDEKFLFTTTAPIYSPSGTMEGDHGTASGAEVTNGGETVINDYCQRRILEILKQLLPTGWRIVVRRANGDDSVLIFAISIDYEIFKKALLLAVEKACDECGLNIQLEKQEISLTHGFFCQHIYWYDISTNQLVWMYPTSLILNAIINPQKEYTPAQWDKDYRDIDIVEKLDNGAQHPWFHLLIDYVNKGMKFPLLGRSEQETARILSKYDKYRSLQSLGERYNRRDYHISKSPTVSYVLATR